jgi:starvation-inducible DNA-binding protein
MAGQRHSAADVELIKACRKAVMEHAASTAAHADAMKLMFEQLGDDLQDLDTVDSRQAETDAVRSVKAADLPGQLIELLGANTLMWYKASAIHWNLTGADFPQYHGFFAEVYGSLDEVIDSYAEFVRSLDYKVPNTLMQLCMMQPAEMMGESLPEMVASITIANLRMLDLLQGGVYFAGVAGEYGIQNFLQDRLAYHQKLRWMLKAILTPTAELPEPEEPEEPGEVTEPAEMEIESAIASDDGKRQYNSLAQQLLYVMRGAQ